MVEAITGQPAGAKSGGSRQRGLIELIDRFRKRKKDGSKSGLDQSAAALLVQPGSRRVQETPGRM
jgi:hypothetical protein